MRWAVLCFAGFLTATASRAATIQVPSQQPTIQAGIDAASNGDTVLVAPGLYTEHLSVSGKAVHVISSKGADSTFFRWNGVGTNAILFGDGGTFSGFTWENQSISSSDNSLLMQGGKCTLSHNVFRNLQLSYDLVVSGYTGTCLITRNTFSHILCPVLIACVGAVPTITNNTIDGTIRGIVTYTYGAVVKNNIISGCSEYGFYDSWYNAKELYNCFWNNAHNRYDNGPIGRTDITVDPQFESAATGNYHLKLTSPCIDFGDVSTQFDEADGTRSDIGAIPIGDYGQIRPLAGNITVIGADIHHRIPLSPPSFSWSWVDDPGYQQVMYQIQATTAESWETVDAWDSGPVQSSATLAIYDGVSLLTHRKYRVRIRLYNGSQWGSWSETYFVPFTPGPLRVPAELPHIQSAIDIAVDFDTILVASGVYVENLVYMGKVVLKSEEGREATSIHPADTAYPCIIFGRREDSLAIVDGFTISGGTATGIYCENASPTITNCDISYFSSPLDGAALYCGDSSAPHIYGTRFHNNRIMGSNSGGAIAFSGSRANTLLIIGNDIYDNAASGVSAKGDKYTISRNLIRDNVGNGLFAGIGINTDNAFGNNLIANNTIVRNTMGIVLNYCPTTIIENTIVAFNTSRGLDAQALNNKYNDEWGNGLDLLFGSDCISEDPQFVDMSANDFHLSEPSPCRDAGDPAEQFRDPDGTRNDIGLYPYDNSNKFPLVQSMSLVGEELMHVVSPTPKFSWQINSASQSDLQESEVQVGSDTDWAVAEMWSPSTIPGPLSEVVYDGYPMSKGAYYYLRVRVRDTVGWSPWRQMAFRTNTPPPMPTLIGPNGQAFNSDPFLWVATVSDAEGDLVWYEFQAYGDSTLRILLWEYQDCFTDDSHVIVNFYRPWIENQIYWWRVAAYDEYQFSEWTPPMTFATDSFPTPPNVVGLTSPISNSIKNPTFERSPLFGWSQARDHDPFENFTYTLQMSQDSTFANSLSVGPLTTTSLQFTDTLLNGTRYWWRVIATDKTGLSSPNYLKKSFWIWELGDLDHTGGTDLGDLVTLIDHLYIGFSPIEPIKIGDLDGDCRIDISDISSLIDRLYISFQPLRIGCE